jgi:HTH-type transcriptional regulator / antitoxin HigA
MIPGSLETYEFLRSEADYQAALTRIEVLTGANPTSPEGEELETLLDLVAAFEDEHFPYD